MRQQNVSATTHHVAVHSLQAVFTRLPRSGKAGPLERHAAAASAAPDTAGAAQELAGSSGKEGEPAPWLLGFQCNERYLQWDDSAQVQLLKIYVARELGRDVAWVEGQLGVLRAVLPDLVGGLHRMKASLLLGLVADTQVIADKMVRLKALLPGVDASRLVLRCPALVLFHEAAALEANLEKLRATLQNVKVEKLVDREPLLLVADVEFLLEEAQRLLPPGQDPVAYLVANPGTLLDMQQAGLDSAIDGNLWTA